MTVKMEAEYSSEVLVIIQKFCSYSPELHSLIHVKYDHGFPKRCHWVRIRKSGFVAQTHHLDSSCVSENSLMQKGDANS
jgi:hypothetical protein